MYEKSLFSFSTSAWLVQECYHSQEARSNAPINNLPDEVMKLRVEKYLMDFKIHVKDDEFPCAKFVRYGSS